MLQWISQSKALEVPVEELGNRIRYDKLYLHATFKNVASRSLDYTMKANWYRTHWKNYFQDNRDWARTDRFGAETQFGYIFPFLRPQTLTFGSEAVYHRSRSLIYGNPESWDAALYAEDEVKFSDWGTLTAGARFDYHDLVGVTVDNQISPRIGLVLHPTKGTSMRLSAGRGFRAPSIAEVFADISVAGIRVVPNPDLHDAEKATSAEAGVSHTWLFGFDGRDDSTRFFDAPSRWLRNRFDLRLSADASCFMSRYENMIDVDLNPELMAFQFMNYGKAAIDGFEAKADASVFGGFLSGHAGYTRLDPEDLKTHKILNYRSRHRVVAGLEIRAGQWTFGFDYRYASRIEEVVNLYSTDERVPMHVTDGRIRLDLGDVDFALEGKNLGNYSYTLRQRLLEPVRHFVLTMRIKT
jgi:outer membrane receptor protein involved in Fe transport